MHRIVHLVVVAFPPLFQTLRDRSLNSPMHAPIASLLALCLSLGLAGSATAQMSTDATLSNLVLEDLDTGNAIVLTPTFSSDVERYTASVLNSVARFTIMPTATDTSATIECDGNMIPSGTPYDPQLFGLNEAVTIRCSIVGTAADGNTTKTYILTITRATATANTAPSITTSEATVTYRENRVGTVETYTSSDAESNTVTWSIGGADATLFSIDATSGALTFKNPPNFENKQDADANNQYQVTIIATDDGSPPMHSEFAVTVTNIATFNTQTSVDTTRPTIVSITSTTQNGVYKAGDSIQVTVTYNEAMTPGTRIELATNIHDTSGEQLLHGVLRDPVNAREYTSTFILGVEENHPADPCRQPEQW